MSGTCKGGGASADECGCDGKASNHAADPKREGWGRVLNSLWPRGMPFPPAAPWAGAVVKRSNLDRVIQEMPDKLPTLPVTAVGSESHFDNLVAIADFLSLDAPPRNALVLRSCGCLDKGCDESDDTSGDEATSDGSGCGGDYTVTERDSDAQCLCDRAESVQNDIETAARMTCGGEDNPSYWLEYDPSQGPSTSCRLYVSCETPEDCNPVQTGAEQTTHTFRACSEE